VLLLHGSAQIDVDVDVDGGMEGVRMSNYKI